MLRALLGNWGRSRSRLDAYTAELEEEVARLRDLAGCAYQAMGVHDAPVHWMDTLAAAAMGQPFTVAGLLPYMPDAVCDAQRSLESVEARSQRMRYVLDRLAERFRTAKGEASDRRHITREELDILLVASGPEPWVVQLLAAGEARH